MKSKNIITLFIRLAALSLLVIWALAIVKSFIGVLAWAIILAVAIYPFYQNLVAKTGAKRKKMVSILFALITITLLAIPSYSILGAVLENTTELMQKSRDNTLEIPHPTEKVKDWPMGEEIYSNWENASQNIKVYATAHKEFILENGKRIFGSFFGIIGVLIVFTISLVIAVVFMYNADGSYNTSVKLANKLIGKDGEDMVIMSRNTIRSVVNGILLVAVVQTLLSFIGFKLIGLPAVGLFTMIVLFSAIVQVPVTLAVIPAIALAFSLSDNTTHTVIFAVYIILVSLLDNILKPILLAKGLQTPTIIIFLGAIGGVMLHGIVGLFVGTVVLALVHRFYLHWVNSSEVL